MSEDSSKPAAGYRPAKNLGPPPGLLLKTVAIFIVSQFVAAFIAGIALGILHPYNTPSLDQSVGAQFAYILIAEGLAFWLVIRLVRRRGLKPAFIGFGRRPGWRDGLWALAGFVAFYGLLIVATLILSRLIPSLNFQQAQDVGFNTVSSSLDKLLAFLALVILPPLGEETLLRGYFYSGLRIFWKFWPAALLTSLLFGLAHLQLGSGTAVLWAAGVDTFILSMVLVFLREKTNALYAGMIVHALNNLVAFGVHFHGVLF